MQGKNNTDWGTSMHTNKCRLIAVLSLCATVAVPGLSFGALINRGGGLIYDTDLNITWLADANYARTSGYDADGLMIWEQAKSWAANLSYYDSVRGVTYDDWRMPTSITCSGYNCTGSEMGHLFYNELGGVNDQFIATTNNGNSSLFTSIQPNYYWSATTDTSRSYSAWLFSFRFGNQLFGSKANSSYAWAVRAGDVAAVPVPTAAWLFGSGLLGIIGVVRRKAA